MAQANTADFLGSGGTFTDPFAGLVSPISADDQAAMQANEERRRRDLLQKASNQAANANESYNIQRHADELQSQQHGSADWWEAQFANGTEDPNDPHNQAEYQAAVKLRKSNHDANNSGWYKALTGGILAAPAAITGGAAAFGGGAALGFGGGEAVGGAAAAPAITTGGAVEVPTMAAPALASAVPDVISGAGAPVLGGAAAGAGSGGGSAAAAGLSPFAKGLINGGVQAGLPLLIQGLTGGRTAEEKALLRKQEELAADAQRRQGEVQDARMNSLAQQVLAFNPRNQMLAQMFGPSAAFTPQQMAGMVQGPPPPSLPPNPTPEQKAAHDARMQQYQASEAARQKTVMGGFQQPGPGPAPLNMPPPQAARKY